MVKRVTFKNRRNQKMIGFFYFPEGKGPFPIVVYFHGLSIGKRTRSAGYLAKLLPKLGFAYFVFNMTGHGESDGKLEDVTPSKAAEDARAAVALVKKQKAVDKNRIGLFGSSYGGYVAIRVAANDSTIKVLVLKSPAVDYAEVRKFQIGDFGIAAWKKLGIMYVWHRKEEKGYILKYQFYQDSLKNPGYKWVPKIKASTLVVQGDKDTYVPISQSRKLYDLLKAKPKKRVVIKDGDHKYKNPKHRTRFNKLAVDWFKKYL